MDLLTLKVGKIGQGWCFELDDGDYTWVNDTMGGVPVSVREGYPYDATWHCYIDAKKQTVVCYAATGEGALYERVFPLNTGVLVLSRIQEYSYVDGYGAGRIHASFRPIELQELLDRYDIIAICNENPNGPYRDLEESVYDWVSDGQICEDLSWCTVVGHTVSDATWLLTKIFLFDENRYAYVLHTRKKLTPEMAKSFEEHGVEPVT